jgi:glutaredoxin
MILYTKSGCSPCLRVKQYIMENEIPIGVVNLTLNHGLIKDLKERGMKTVPCLDMDGELIQDSVRIIKILEGKDI